MTKLEQIEREVCERSADELAHFREWFVAFDAMACDRQTEADAASGRLDGLADAALADHGPAAAYATRFISAAATARRLAPATRTARMSSSTETVGSPRSIFATRD